MHRGQARLSTCVVHRGWEKTRSRKKREREKRNRQAVFFWVACCCAWCGCCCAVAANTRWEHKPVGLQALEAAVAGAHRALRARRAAEVALTSLREASHVAKKGWGKKSKTENASPFNQSLNGYALKKSIAPAMHFLHALFFAAVPVCGNLFCFHAAGAWRTERGKRFAALLLQPHSPSATTTKNVCRKCNKASSCPTAATQS